MVNMSRTGDTDLGLLSSQDEPSNELPSVSKCEVMFASTLLTSRIRHRLEGE